MIEKKYLGELLTREEVLAQNTFIVAPVGSGKSYFIFDNLIQNGMSVLYLCDTNNLQQATIKAKEEMAKNKFISIMVLTYHDFGGRVEYDSTNEFINKFDVIFCDEIHNLIDFQRFDNSTSLAIARTKLLSKYDNVKIVLMTATPENLYAIERKHCNFLDNFKVYDFSERKDIKQYTNKRLAYISHYTDIERQLIQYHGYFETGGQCLVYSVQVGVMKEIEKICEKLGIKAICIWSNNYEEEMTPEQKSVRNHLIERNELADPYQVLIINRATETGVNIENWSSDEKPHRMNLMICNCTNETQITQSRGRIRHDIDLLVLKTNDDSQKEFYVESNILDIWLTKDTITERVIIRNNIRDDRGRLIGVKALKEEIKKYGYELKTTRKTIQGKKITQYKIIKIK